MSRLLICTGGGEPAYSTNQSFVYALRSLGHDVLVCGPGYWGRNFANVPVPDQPFPERYLYEEILEKTAFSGDLILQLEPHFYLYGKKPPKMRSAYLVTDPHRGGEAYYRLAKEGSFDALFIGQKHFLPLFDDLPCHTQYLPVAFDPRRFDHAPLSDPVCDIAFCGQSGIGGLTYDYQDELGRYATAVRSLRTWDSGRYEFNAPTFDYSERAEILLRLMQDFHVRIYEPLYDERYMKAIQKGVLGFQRSLLNDISIRCYEIMAAGRLLVTDRIPGLDEWFGDEVNDDLPCALYDSYYKVFTANFDLEYKKIYKLIKNYLDDDTEREYFAARARQTVWGEHRWQARAKTLLEIVLN